MLFGQKSAAPTPEPERVPAPGEPISAQETELDEPVTNNVTPYDYQLEKETVIDFLTGINDQLATAVEQAKELKSILG